MLNRRGFLGAMATGLVGTCVAAKIPTGWIPAPVRRHAAAFTRLTYKGVPLTWDVQCAETTLFYFNSEIPR